MTHIRRMVIVCALIVFPLIATGCQQILHNMHPERLWRLNRGPAIGTVDATFSVSDDEATAMAEKIRSE